MDGAESVGGPAVVIGKCMNVLVKDATSVSDLEPSGIVEPEDLKILEIITRYDLVTFDHAVLNREVRVYSLSESHGKDYSLLRGEYLPAVLAGNNCNGARFRGGGSTSVAGP
jgi:hypothetical protein